MKKIFDLNKKLIDRNGISFYLDNKGEIEATIGSFFIKALDSASDKGDEARRCIDLANQIEKAIKDGKNEIAFEENSAINFIKQRVENFAGNAYVQYLIQEMFQKTEEEYQKRNDNIKKE